MLYCSSWEMSTLAGHHANTFYVRCRRELGSKSLKVRKFGEAVEKLYSFCVKFRRQRQKLHLMIDAVNRQGRTGTCDPHFSALTSVRRFSLVVSEFNG